MDIELFALRTDTLFTPAPKRDWSFYLSTKVVYKASVVAFRSPLSGNFVVLGIGVSWRLVVRVCHSLYSLVG